MRNTDLLMLTISLALLTAACTPRPEAASAPANRSASGEHTPHKDVAPVDSTEGLKAADIKGPDAASVMYMIYNKDGDGATSYEVENGSVATYWYGHTFELDKTTYFVGFAYDTPEKFDGDDGVPDPDQGVNLTHATFKHSAADAAKPWVFDGAELSIGEFGSREKAHEVDTTRKVEAMTTANGRYLLAVPTSFFDNGVTSYSYDVFSFEPGELAKVSETHWTHLGTLDAGADNSQACDGGNVVPCWSSKGELAFESNGAGGWPNLRISQTGTTSSGPGTTRTLGPSDVQTYRYNAGTKTYSN